MKRGAGALVVVLGSYDPGRGLCWAVQEGRKK